MEKNRKYLNVYIFLSTFARQLIEVFIPLILYKFGYTLKEVLIYFFLVNVFSLILSYPSIYISKKITNKIMALIGIIAFGITQIMLSMMVNNIVYIIILSFFYAIYRRAYWVSRRYYSLVVIPKDDAAKKYSIISIVNQLAIVVSTYIGSLFLEFISINSLTIFSIIMFLISIIPLAKIDYKEEKNNEKIEFLETVKKFPKSNLYLIGTYELTHVIKFLFTLYIFIYIKDTYQMVGLLNLISNLSIIIFSYCYGKKINGDKDYLKISIFLVTFVYFLKINTLSGKVLMVLYFFEGFCAKMHEISISKCYLKFGKQFEYYNYNLAYEICQNTFRSLILLSCLFIGDLKIMIYITFITMFIGIFLNFKYEKIEEKSKVKQ